MKAVLTTKVSPDYDDLPEQRYHFPATYLNQIERAVGDWILYYEPRRSSGDLSSSGGRQSYFAVARIDRIVRDPRLTDHFYAYVSGYLPFPKPVPFRLGHDYFERGLAKVDGSTNRGAFGRSVRNLSDAEFDRIWNAGFGLLLDAAKSNANQIPGFAEPMANFGTDAPPETVDREIIAQLVNRPFRDRAFAAAVKTAYGDTCAMTGLRIINGGGRSEVQAAHIRPVEKSGPDSVRNGLALSSTVHWMFDRGLVSIDEDFGLLVAQDRLPDAATRLLNPDRRLRLPLRMDMAPHPQFLRYHREHVFKG